MRNIYIVDDDDGVRNSLHAFLSTRKDLVVRSFSSGDMFLSEAEALKGGVLLLDYTMAGSDGIMVLRTLRERGLTEFGAVMLTGAGNINLAVRAIKAGALDFIEKPYDAAILLDITYSAFSKLDEDSAEIERASLASTKINRLAPRERDVLRGLIEGHANKVIAHDLDISSRTVEIYRANLMKKLDVRSLPQLLRIAFSAGLIPQP